MRDSPVPVDDGTAALAQRVLLGVVLLPTVVGLVLAVLARLIAQLAGTEAGPPFPGLLSCLVVVGALQLAIIAVGRTHYLSGVLLHAEAPAQLIRTEPGIFHCETH